MKKCHPKNLHTEIIMCIGEDHFIFLPGIKKWTKREKWYIFGLWENISMEISGIWQIPTHLIYCYAIGTELCCKPRTLCHLFSVSVTSARWRDWLLNDLVQLSWKQTKVKHAGVEVGINRPALPLCCEQWRPCHDEDLPLGASLATGVKDRPSARACVCTAASFARTWCACSCVGWISVFAETPWKLFCSRCFKGGLLKMSALCSPPTHWRMVGCLVKGIWCQICA